MYFYAEFAEKTRDLRKRVSALRNSMRLGLKGQGNSEDPAKRVLLNKIGPDYSGPKGPRRGNNRQGDDTGSSRNSQAQSLVAPLNYQSAERKAREYTTYALEEAITVTARKDQALDLEDLPVPSTVGSRVQARADEVQSINKGEKKSGWELDALKAAKLTLEGTKHGAPPMTTRVIGSSPEDIPGDTERESGIEAAMKSFK
ncbi:hypothetical protein C8J56DRAFT_898951 [Mycena floridula]|nr:hypothetical protein C8J56DRAFT_898951 [Mycena floridula]